MRVLSLHAGYLISQYRGPTILNMADEPPAEPPKDPPAEPPKDPPKDPPKEPAPGSAEARVKGALDKADAAERRAKEAEEKLKAIDDAKKKDEEEKAKKRGEHEKLLTEKEEALKKLTGDHETISKTNKEYEEIAQAQVDAALKGIADEKKRAAVEKLLEGRSMVEKFKLLPEALALAGANSGGFGGGTQRGNNQEPTTKEGLESRLNDLVRKAEEKILKGESMTYEEQKEQREIEKKLQELKFPTT